MSQKEPTRLHRTRDERKLLKKLSKEMKTNILEFLTITACDDGAVGDVSVEPCDDNSGMVRITIWRKTTALDTQGWIGFESSQLW